MDGADSTLVRKVLGEAGDAVEEDGDAAATAAQEAGKTALSLKIRCSLGLGASTTLHCIAHAGYIMLGAPRHAACGIHLL